MLIGEIANPGSTPGVTRYGTGYKHAGHGLK